MQKTSGSRTASATSSSAARSTRRSSHSTISRLTLRRGRVGPTPALLEALGDERVDVEVHGAHRVGVEGVAVEQGALGRQVVVVDEDDDPVHADVHRRLGAVGLEGPLLAHVLAVKANQSVVHDRPDDDDDPRALGELGDDEDDDDDRGDDGRQRVDEDAAAPVADLSRAGGERPCRRPRG